jgi:hypothetical protein
MTAQERGPMKKFIVVSIIMALTLLAWSSFAPSHAQESVKEEKPTFYRLIPGVYVNGWPRFTIRYPKDWVERPPNIQEVFRASPPGRTGDLFTGDLFTIVVSSVPQPLDRLVDVVGGNTKIFAKDVTILKDRPSQLSNGTPAREVELRGIMTNNGLPFNLACLGVRHGDVWIVVHVFSPNGSIGEDLKAILYSVEFQPGKDEPVKVPPDVQEFLDSFSSAWVSHDLARLMSLYSDRYLNSGVRKGEVERVIRLLIGPITTFEVGITDFVAAGDRAYLAGFVVSSWGKGVLTGTSIIKENGEWKWYGNQRDVSP